MTSKERLLCALKGEKPDRLPATVHQWQGYHLDKYMGGISGDGMLVHNGNSNYISGIFFEAEKN